MDPSGGYSIHYCEFVENGLGLGGFGDGLAVTGGLVSTFNAFQIGRDVHGSMSNAASELFADVNAANGVPGGYVSKGGDVVWDYGATSSTEGYLTPGEWHYNTDGSSCLYYTTQDNLLFSRFDDLASLEIVASAPSAISFSDVLHTTLDILEFIPGFGNAVSFIHTAVYLVEGNYEMAKMAAGGIIAGGFFGLGLKFGAKLLTKSAGAAVKTAVAVSNSADNVVVAETKIANKAITGTKQSTKKATSNVASNGAKQKPPRLDTFVAEDGTVTYRPASERIAENSIEAAATTGLANARALGVAGEQAVGVSSKVRIESLTGTASYRVPDILTRTTLGEVKNVSHLSLTRQLTDFHLYSQQNGLQFILHTRPTTTFSGPLQNLIDNGSIIVEPILFR